MKHILAVILFVLSITIAFSQSGTNDETFNIFNTCPNLGGFNNGVNSIVVQSDGKIVVGGIFTTYKGVPVNRIARLNSDGTQDGTFIAGFNFDVNSLSLQSDGKIIVAGKFTSGISNGIIRLNTDGSTDPSFNTGTGFDTYPIILGTKIQTDGKILVFGNQQSFNGTTTNKITRLNTDGSLDPTFNLTGTGFNVSIPVLCMAIQSDGKIVVGGDFLQYNGSSRNKIARLNSNGTLDVAFNPGTGFNSTVNSISIQNDGKIITGGVFTVYNGINNNYIARINTDGSFDSSFNTASGITSLVYATAIQLDGKIIVGGGNTLTRTARLNADGSLDNNYNPGNGHNNNVRTIAIQTNGKIISGGDFSTYDDMERVRISIANTDGTRDTLFNPVTGFDNTVYCTARQTDGKIIAGGGFTLFNDFPVKRIVRLNSNGSIDLTFTSGLGFDGIVYSSAIQSDGKIILGGNFTSYNGIAINRIIRLNSNGTFDPTFNPVLGFNGIVYSIVIQIDGKIIAGGAFTTINGNNANRIARLNTDGSLDPTFNTGTGFNSVVKALEIQQNGKIIAVGSFAAFNGVSRVRIARINTDGTLDETFIANFVFYGGLNAIKVQTDNKIIVGGTFVVVQGNSVSNFARLNTDGSIDPTFYSGSVLYGGNSGSLTGVHCIDIQTNGKLIVGGSFTTCNGISRNNIVGLNSNGTIDASFNQGSGFNKVSDITSVYSVMVDPNGKIIVGGRFDQYNGICRNYIARLNGSCVNSFGTNSVEACGSYTWINGVNYTSNNNTATFVLQNSAGCDSTVSLNLIINNTSTPIGLSSQIFCNSGTVNDLVASGFAIQWYANATGGLPLASSISLVNGATYYASQTISGCESTSRLSVSVSINAPTAPLGGSTQTFCNSATVNDLVASGSSIQWYASQSGGSPLAPTTNLLNNNTYYASQTISGCESTSRLSVSVSINAPTAPLGASTQTFCNSATVNDLVASGSSIQWYASQSGGSPLAPTTNLLNNNTYYASQTIAGCESVSLLAVNIFITSVSDITTSLLGATISSNNTLSSYIWLDCSNSFLILSGETSQNFTPSVNGSYSVQLTENGCIDTSLCVSISSISLVEKPFIDNIIIYPNPNSGNFTVDIGQVTDKIDVTVLDLQGRIVLRKGFTQTYLFQMNLNDRAGIYFVSISSEHGKSLVKIIIE